MAKDEGATARLKRRNLCLTELDRMRVVRSRTGAARRRDAERRAISRRNLLNAY
ncbi:MAG TPA: hypothetical protein VHU88_00535 [Sporichthyaceae bacterium]|jgi:hypothetical protein|nr:hypothetical protein [Sporichthyaceae bacterium]